jgi:hypothetical protein
MGHLLLGTGDLLIKIRGEREGAEDKEEEGTCMRLRNFLGSSSGNDDNISYRLKL